MDLSLREVKTIEQKFVSRACWCNLSQRRGRVPIHEQFTGNIYEAQLGDAEEQVPESGDSFSHKLMATTSVSLPCRRCLLPA
jgi:hypothetical protein